MSSVSVAPRVVPTGTLVVTQKMRDYIEDILATAQVSYGAYSKQFETEFARLHGREFAILSNSGTSALHIALQAMKAVYGWADGDEVVLPATTFIATANIILHNRMQPVFVDVEEDFYCLNPRKLEQAITKRTRAVIPVNMFGQSSNMTVIQEISHLEGLHLIEDSCEAMFVKHAGLPIGSLSDIACFSTYVAHLLVTGVGGLSLTDDPELAGLMRSLVNHGLDLNNLNPDSNFQPRPMIGRRFHFTSIGHSFRITEFEAALGLAQLDTHKEMLATRRRNAKHLTAGLKMVNEHYNSPMYLPVEREEGEHAWMMYPIILDIGPDGHFVDKQPLMAHLNAAGIETRDMPSLIGQPAYSWIDSENFPVSSWISRCGFYVGCHQALTPDDIQYTVQTIGEWYDQHRPTTTA